MDAQELFWKWLLAVSLVTIIAVGGYVVSLQFWTDQQGSTSVSEPNLALVGPQVARLTPSSDKEESGQARREWDGEQFQVSVEAKLPELGEGEFYKVWLGKKNADDLEFSRIEGKLEHADDCDCFRLTTNLDEASGYATVVIVTRTREGEVETYDHVLKGEFRSEDADDQGE